MIDKRVEIRLEALNDILVAYAGTQERFTRRSKIPTQAIWQAYELMKDGISPEGIGFYLRLGYPINLKNPGVVSLLSLVLQKAQGEYINSGHVIEYNPNQFNMTHRKN